jgi:hypothetical protein
VTANEVGPLEFLSRHARAMPDAMLAVMETLGVVAVLSIIAWRPANLELALPFISISMFSFWGIAEHTRLTKDPLRRDASSVALAIAQKIAAAIGIIAATMLVFSVVGRVIGPIIS